MRDIPNGVYNSINGILSYVNSSEDPLRTAKELKADLERVKKGEAIKSKHISKVERFLRNNKQTVTVALAVLTLAIAAYKYGQKPKEIEINNCVNQTYVTQIYNLKNSKNH